MANFETPDYRKGLAQNLRNAPKDNRKKILSDAKETPQYGAAREEHILRKQLGIAEKNIRDLEERLASANQASEMLLSLSRDSIFSADRRLEELRRFETAFEGVVGICERIQNAEDGPAEEVRRLIQTLIQKDESWITEESGDDPRLFLLQESLFLIGHYGPERKDAKALLPLLREERLKDPADFQVFLEKIVEKSKEIEENITRFLHDTKARIGDTIKSNQADEEQRHQLIEKTGDEIKEISDEMERVGVRIRNLREQLETIQLGVSTLPENSG